LEFRVQFDRRFLKELDSLHPTDQSRIIQKIKEMASVGDIFPHHRLKDPQFEKQYRLRVGSWRVVYDIDHADHRIIVYSVKHRSEAYK